MSAELNIDNSPVLVEPMAMSSFMVSLLGLILPIVPALVALLMARTASKRIQASGGLSGGMNYVRAAQILAGMNFIILAGILAAAWYLSN